MSYNPWGQEWGAYVWYVCVVLTCALRLTVGVDSNEFDTIVELPLQPKGDGRSIALGQVAKWALASEATIKVVNVPARWQTKLVSNDGEGRAQRHGLLRCGG